MFHVGIFLDLKIMKGVVLYDLISLQELSWLYEQVWHCQNVAEWNMR